jgi:hypothetical protein
MKYCSFLYLDGGEPSDGDGDGEEDFAADESASYTSTASDDAGMTDLMCWATSSAVSSALLTFARSDV